MSVYLIIIRSNYTPEIYVDSVYGVISEAEKFADALQDELGEEYSIVIESHELIGGYKNA
jgi:hypothetical protein